MLVLPWWRPHSLKHPRTSNRSSWPSILGPPLLGQGCWVQALHQSALCPTSPPTLFPMLSTAFAEAQLLGPAASAATIHCDEVLTHLTAVVHLLAAGQVPWTSPLISQEPPSMPYQKGTLMSAQLPLAKPCDALSPNVVSHSERPNAGLPPSSAGRGLRPVGGRSCHPHCPPMVPALCRQV